MGRHVGWRLAAKFQFAGLYPVCRVIYSGGRADPIPCDSEDSGVQGCEMGGRRGDRRGLSGCINKAKPRTKPRGRAGNNYRPIHTLAIINRNGHRQDTPKTWIITPVPKVRRLSLPTIPQGMSAGRRPLGPALLLSYSVRFCAPIFPSHASRGFIKACLFSQ